MGHVNQVGHLSKTPLNLLEIHEIGPVDTSESKQQNDDQIWHMQPPYQKLLGLSYVSWLFHSYVFYCRPIVYSCIDKLFNVHYNARSVASVKMFGITHDGGGEGAHYDIM